MVITTKALKEIINKIKSFIINKRIEDIVLVNSRLFLFYFKKEDKQLLIDLDNNNPHIGIIKSNYEEVSLPSNFISRALNKGRPLIEDIELENEDKVIKITSSAVDAYYHKNKFYLFIELIKSHANMILTDQNKKIITAFYETSINAPRAIVSNLTYIMPSKEKYIEKETEFNYKEYQKYIEDNFIASINKRKKELFSPLFKKYEKKEKSLKKKIEKIRQEKEKAKELDRYKEYGETLLMNISSINKGDIEFRGIKLDKTKSVSENANIYFNKYKKAKRTLSQTEIILNSLNKELEETTYYLELINNADENVIKELTNPKIKSNKEINSKAYLPYLINYQGINYYCGHNALENDYLTFKMFKKSSDVIWMHIKDKPSSHLIINSNRVDNKILDIACSILLLVNKQTSGEIMYTSRKNITRGEGLAKVNILSYKSINMRKINELAYNLLKREKRAHE